MNAKEFVEKILNDPEYQAEFSKNPDRIMKRDEVPKSVRLAVRRGDLELLGRALGITIGSNKAPWPY